MVKAWVAPSPKVEANMQQLAATHEALRQSVQEIGEFLVMRECNLSAKERMAWLAEGVRTKSSLGAQACPGDGQLFWRDDAWY